MRRYVMLLLAAAVLAPACGFKLQAPAGLPQEMAQTRIITGDPYSHFIRRLTILLEQNGARVDTGAAGAAVLEIPINEVRKEILSIGDTARVREYRVRHRVRFRLLDAAGNELVPVQTIERSRVISFDEQDILAASREEEFLRKELADTLSRLVLRELGRG